MMYDSENYWKSLITLRGSEDPEDPNRSIKHLFCLSIAPHGRDGEIINTLGFIIWGIDPR